jgi:transcription initiation factor TFIIIB Brf1 subunit/transcription initiation factor TFIIB
MSDFDILDQLIESFSNDCDINKINENIITEKKESSVCTHSRYVTEKDDICVDCGQILDSSSLKNTQRLISDQNRLQIRRDVEKTIYNDVTGMGFSDKIVNTANDIYMAVTEGSIKRGASRKGFVFACIFYAYKLHGVPCSYDLLVNTFRLKRRICSRGIRFLNLYSPKNLDIKSTNITPLNLIDGIMSNFGANAEQKKEVVELYDRISNRSSKLNRSRPQSVASSLVYYWMCKNNIGVSIKEFIKRISLSELTINKLTKEITSVLTALEKQEEHKN